MPIITATPAALSLPARAFVHAGVATEVLAAPRLTASIEVRNVFDERYATFGAFGDTEEVELEEAPGATDPRSLGPGSPRRFTVGISARFGG